MSLIGDNFDSTPLTGQRGANLLKFPGKHKIRLTSLIETKQTPGVGVDAVLIASTSGRLEEGSHVGWPAMKGKFPEYFYSALKRIIGYALGVDPEKVQGKHVAAILAGKGAKVKDKIIVVETTAPNEEGYSNINILGGDLEVVHKVPAAGQAYVPPSGNDDVDGVAGSSESADDALGDLLA